MFEKVTAETLSRIANPALRDYAQRYIDIEAGFREAVAAFGVPFAEADGDEASDERGFRTAGGCEVPKRRAAADRDASGVLDVAGGCETAGNCAAAGGETLEGLTTPVGRDAAVEALAAYGLRSYNDGKSLVANWLSPACEACRLGLCTETFVMTLACPRRCFFCFNPNQADFDGRASGPRDVVAQLEERADQGANLLHVALTGGEPLLYPDESVAFFQRASELFPGAHTRLYTSGWGLSEALLARLRDAGLSEIRFSIKTDDAPEELGETLGLIGLACNFIPDVMVEMPVMPDEVSLMKQLLLRLNGFGVRGVNLLELGFPLYNGEEFARRGYRLKAEPYRVLYDYAYAAGLPVAGSEAACLELLDFVLREGLSIGAHYCSMENKHTGQVFQQNWSNAKNYPLRLMSPRDHFLKSAKVFGADRAAVREMLETAGEPFEENDDFDFTEFSLAVLPSLSRVVPDAPVAVSYAICEPREEGVVLRELRLDLTTPATFQEVDW